MRPDSKFDGDDLRRTGPKFQQPRFAQYLAAVARSKTDGTRRSALKHDVKLMRTPETNGCFE